MRERLDDWRRASARGFVEDPALFGQVIAARVARDAAPAEQRPTHVDNEVRALVDATRGLVALLGVSISLATEAATMGGSFCAPQALGEAATARILAEAATDSLVVMADANIIVIRRRGADAGEDMPLEPLRQDIEALPEGRAREVLTARLSAT